MKKYLLQSWLKIAGLTAISGLAYENNQLQLVSDNTNALYHYFINNDSLAAYPLTEEPIEKKQIKKKKLDLEALTKIDNTWYAFASGSTENRNKAFVFNKFSKHSTFLNLKDLYEEMKIFSSLNNDDFNIEGVTTYNGDWIFLNRGNGPKNANYLFVVQGKNLIDDFNIYYFEFKLPTINNVKTGFSDATVVNNTLFFIATAENSDGTFNDGKIEGSIFGAIDLKKMKLLFSEKISDTDKFEGITVLQHSKREVTFALVADNDNDELTHAEVIKLHVTLKNKIK